MRSQGEKGLTKMAATAKDDATATLTGDDEKDFGQEANAKAKSDDAKASGKTSGKAKDDAAKNLGKDADGEAEDDDAAKNLVKDADGEAGSDKDHKEAFVGLMTRIM